LKDDCAAKRQTQFRWVVVQNGEETGQCDPRDLEGDVYVKLYDYPLSGHAHRARLFLSLLGVEAQFIEVDLGKGDHRKPDFLAINPFGEVPALDDDGVIVTDSTAILVYLAKKFGAKAWLPEDAIGAANVQRWLSVSSGEIRYGACAARLVTVFGAPYNSKEVIDRAHKILGLIDDELAQRDWIAADHPTIADVALYSYIARSPEGNVDRFRYHNVTAWLARIEALPGFHPFQKTGIGIPDVV
jgi:glutathione S-transferase